MGGDIAELGLCMGTRGCWYSWIFRPTNFSCIKATGSLCSYLSAKPGINRAAGDCPLLCTSATCSSPDSSIIFFLRATTNSSPSFATSTSDTLMKPTFRSTRITGSLSNRANPRSLLFPNGLRNRPRNASNRRRNRYVSVLIPLFMPHPSQRNSRMPLLLKTPTPLLGK